ncbi:cell division protein ZapA [bacterium]|nr:MAG: cell division protein ZapA [bacterium]QQR61837.1 MAG: cell division protein ZapA [bacterium]QQR62581.1 MAG: cell division protein ZapA [bacterium]
MNGERKSVAVTIYGNQYNLVSDESYESLTTVAMLVESTMKEIESKMHNTTNQTTLAVLTSIKFAHALRSLQSETETTLTIQESLVKQIEQAVNIIDSLV